MQKSVFACGQSTGDGKGAGDAFLQPLGCPGGFCAKLSKKEEESHANRPQNICHFVPSNGRKNPTPADPRTSVPLSLCPIKQEENSHPRRLQNFCPFVPLSLWPLPAPCASLQGCPGRNSRLESPLLAPAGCVCSAFWGFVPLVLPLPQLGAGMSQTVGWAGLE